MTDRTLPTSGGSYMRRHDGGLEKAPQAEAEAERKAPANPKKPAVKEA